MKIIAILLRSDNQFSKSISEAINLRIYDWLSQCCLKVLKCLRVLPQLCFMMVIIFTWFIEFLVIHCNSAPTFNAKRGVQNCVLLIISIVYFVWGILTNVWTFPLNKSVGRLASLIDLEVQMLEFRIFSHPTNIKFVHASLSKISTMQFDVVPIQNDCQ